MKKKSIAFVIPYFGKFRKDINIWLYSCSFNPTVNWIIFTDDRGEYNFPSNVRVIYTEFESFKNRLQKLFDFPVKLENKLRCYKLCDFRPALGELLEDDELLGYDFWGYCDMDQVWGDIRSFLTEDILDKYDKVGFLGNGTLFRNTKDNNRLYRKKIHGRELYKEIFSDVSNCFFDEVGINDIFLQAGVPIYNKVICSNLLFDRHNFAMAFLPKKEQYKNKNVIYLWDNGKVYHVYEHKNKVEKMELMYVHFLYYRTMQINLSESPLPQRFLIVPTEIVPYTEITLQFLREKSKSYWIKYIYHQLKYKNFYQKFEWLKAFVVKIYYFYVHPGVFNYWHWTNYDKNKKDRFYLLERS